jgi:HEPN domain-containing protein
LKGFLFFHDIEPPKIHDLNDLLGMCVKYDINFSTLLPKMHILTTYAVIPRYPNELGITSEDMKTAIRYAKDVQEFVLRIISELQKNGTI